LLQEQRIAAGPLDALRGESIGVDEAARERKRVDGGERREVNGDQGCAARHSAPMGVQRIAFETGRHCQNAAARGSRARDRRKKAERLGVRPMDVLDRDEQRSAIRRSFHQLGDDALLAERPGRRIHCLIDPARRLRLRNLEQIAQIKRIVGLQPHFPHGRIDRAFDNVGRRLGFQADKPCHHRTDGAMSAFGAEIENEARMPRHTRCRGG